MHACMYVDYCGLYRLQETEGCEDWVSAQAWRRERGLCVPWAFPGVIGAARPPPPPLARISRKHNNQGEEQKAGHTAGRAATTVVHRRHGPIASGPDRTVRLVPPRAPSLGHTYRIGSFSPLPPPNGGIPAKGVSGTDDVALPRPHVVSPHSARQRPARYYPHRLWVPCSRRASRAPMRSCRTSSRRSSTPCSRNRSS
jgi:hypothetical protein